MSVQTQTRLEVPEKSPLKRRPSREAPIHCWKLSTALSSDPRCLWELHLTSEVPGVDLVATFLIPVYAAVPSPSSGEESSSAS